jgi:hypothetical protein
LPETLAAGVARCSWVMGADDKETHPASERASQEIEQPVSTAMRRMI